MKLSNSLFLIIFSLLVQNLSHATDDTAITLNERRIWQLPTRVMNASSEQLLKEGIGQDLFFDTRLSGNYKQACATCHSPSLGWSDGLSTSLGREGVSLPRTSPSILNVYNVELLMWDGRAGNLHLQALLPITSSKEMNLPADQLVDRIQEVPAYVTRFEKVYQGGVTLVNIIDALVMFENTVVSKNSRFDQWVSGNNQALTTQEQRGFKLFLDVDKGNCAVCHQAPNFTDNGFHNIGLVDLQGVNPDLGRFMVKPVKVLKGAFRTPSLRDIAVTAPYFHNGTAKNLTEVIDYYVEGGKYPEGVSLNMHALSLNEIEKRAIVAFLKSLSSLKEVD